MLSTTMCISIDYIGVTLVSLPRYCRGFLQRLLCECHHLFQHLVELRHCDPPPPCRKRVRHFRQLLFTKIPIPILHKYYFRVTIVLSIHIILNGGRKRSYFSFIYYMVLGTLAGSFHTTNFFQTL